RSRRRGRGAASAGARGTLPAAWRGTRSTTRGRSRTASTDSAALTQREREPLEARAVEAIDVQVGGVLVAGADVLQTKQPSGPLGQARVDRLRDRNRPVAQLQPEPRVDQREVRPWCVRAI